MAHDFAKQRSNNGRRKKNKGTSSGPIWLVTGVLCGFFLAFLLQLGGFSLVPNSAVPVEHVPTPIADTPANAGDQQQAQTAKKPRFEFYALLPEAEVEVVEEAEVPVVESSASAAKQNTPQNAPLTSVGSAINGTQYVLQAGSFKSHRDADRLRARLLLMGFEANIERAKLSAFDNRHR
ncbi:MAG: SPOR domain-containing protein, partial [Pseudomonadales bacterium]